jgi:hypothetical protein
LLASGRARLQQPAAGILGNAEMIAILSPPESDQRRAAETITGAQRAADLVSKMLAYSGGGRVPAGRPRWLVKEMVVSGASVARRTLNYHSPGRCRWSRPTRRRSARSCST